MAIILDFPSPKHQEPLSPSSDAHKKLAEVVIFPGVRYNRSKEQSSFTPSDGTLGTSSKSRRTKKK